MPQMMTAFPLALRRNRSRTSVLGPAARDWRSAYRFAVGNAGVFLILSLVNSAIGSVPIAWHVAAELIFMVGSGVAYLRMLRAGGSLTAVTWFVLGAGVVFGFGTAYSTMAPFYVYEVLFSPYIQERYLGDINLINSTSVTLVLLVAWLLCGNFQAVGSALGVRAALRVLDQWRAVLLVLVVGAVMLQLWTFPLAQNLILRNIVDKIQIVVWLFILLSFSGWRRLHPSAKLFAITVFLTAFGIGVLTISKQAAVIPILAMMAGLWLSTGSRQVVIIEFFICVAFYFLWLAPTINAVRDDWRYDPARNTLRDRIEIVLNTESPPASDEEEHPIAALLTRFSHAPFEAYLINSYREGVPGDSLADSWVALVPRVFWPEKPNVTRFGEELYERVFETPTASSALAPTYTGEAYWNFGWFGVIIVSLVLGIEVGWFSRKWFQFAHGDIQHLGILVFSVPAIFTVFWVENWIAASYVGGFVTLLVLIKLVDWGGVFLVSRQLGRTGTPVAHQPSS